MATWKYKVIYTSKANARELLLLYLKQPSSASMTAYAHARKQLNAAHPLALRANFLRVASFVLANSWQQRFEGTALSYSFNKWTRL